MTRRKPTWKVVTVLVIAVIVALLIAAVLLLVDPPDDRVGAPAAGADPVLAARADSLVRSACSMCHVFPSPEILPRATWPHAVETMYTIAAVEGVEMPVPPLQATAWYMLRAPDRLPPAPGRTDAGPGPVRWSSDEWRPSDVVGPQRGGGAAPSTGPDPGPHAVPDYGPGVAHVRMAALLGGPGDDLIVSDTPHDRIFALRPYRPAAEPVLLGHAPAPGRVAVVDLDGDGSLDLVVAALGEMRPTDARVGSVVWLRRIGPESFEERPLLEGVGRVADVQAGDLTGNGRPDLVVAVFGWRDNGKVVWLENLGPDDAGRLRFEEHLLDARAGFTDVRIVDLDGDGHLDIVGLATQQWQEVVVYWGGPDGFRSGRVHAAPHPDWGFSGMEVVDFTGDGRPDIIVTNGDGLDITVVKPHHGVGLLENEGGRRFRYRHLTHMYGAYRAEPVDLTGDGRLGLLVSAYIPPAISLGEPDRPEAIVWLERVGPTHLVRRVLRAESPQHMTLAAGDMTGDGRTDFAVGWMDLGFADPEQAGGEGDLRPWVTLWRNLGLVADHGGPEPSAVMDWSADR